MKRFIIIISTFIIAAVVGGSATYFYYATNSINSQVNEVIESSVASFELESVESLQKKSDLIVRGTVSKLLQGKEYEFINTDIEDSGITEMGIDIILNVEETLKGEPYNSKEIRIRVMADRDGGKFVFSKDGVIFEVGENVLLFLMNQNESLIAKENPSEKFYVLLGEYQGKFIQKKNQIDIYENELESLDNININDLKRNFDK